MLKYLSFLLIGFFVFSTSVYSQYSRYSKEKLVVAPRFIEGADEYSFFEDFKNRQIQVQKSMGNIDSLLVDNWDWPSNQIMPPHSFAADFFGDGTYYPVLVETGNSELAPSGTPQRYAKFGYMDALGVTSYFVYGTDDQGFPVRTGWNSHLILDEETNKVYVSIYDFLNSNGLINNHLFEIDMPNDPNTPVQLTDSTTALEAGWPRIALDGNGVFWMLQDIATGPSLGVAASTDGGHTFVPVDSVGSNDPTFWGGLANDDDFSNDPIIMASGDKISTFNFVVRGGSLSRLGINAQDTANPDSANGIYHWYSNDGGSSWQGEWIMLEGDTAISNRRNYEALFTSFSTAAHYVDQTGVSHLIYGDANTPGIVGPDTVNVYAPVYWNDNLKNFIALELPEVESFAFDRNLMNWGNLMALRPFVKADPTGQVVVAMWNRPQFSGEPGNSTVNEYDAIAPDVPLYHFDIAYAYSTDGGATWSPAQIAARSEENSYVYPNIAAIEVNEISRATHDVIVHFTYCWDKVPGHGALTSGNTNSKSLNPYMYDTLSIQVTLTSVDDGTILNGFSLEQNYPNPFNPSTLIKYSIAEKSKVTIKVFDILGEEVATLVNTIEEAGAHQINFNASGLASGLYIYSVQAGDFSASKKMMLLK